MNGFEQHALDLDDPTYERAPRIELSSGSPVTVAPGRIEQGHRPSLIGFNDVVVVRSTDGQFVRGREAAYRISPTKTVPASFPPPHDDQASVAGTTLVLGAHQPIYNNFGHFVADQLPCFWFESDLRRLGCTRIAVLGVRSKLLRERIRELMVRFITIDVELEFQEFGAARYQHALFPQGFTEHPRVKSVALERLIRVKLGPRPTGGRTRLFVSRADATDRFLTNEAELAGFLSERGYRTVLGTQLSIEESIDLFARAEAVVGVSGAAVANVIFCREGTPLVNVGPDDMNGFWYYDLASLFGLRFYDFHAPRLEAARRDRPRSSADFRLDLDAYRRAHAAVFGEG